MTRRRLDRARRTYNRWRRVNSGWLAKQWDQMLSDNADDPEYAWWLRCVARNYR